MTNLCCVMAVHMLGTGPLELDSRILSYRMPLCLDLAPYCKGGDLLAVSAGHSNLSLATVTIAGYLSMSPLASSLRAPTQALF